MICCLVSLALPGCGGGAETLLPDLSENPPPGSELVVELVLPPESAELTSSTTLSALISNGTVDRVAFGVDGAVARTVTSPPYNWTFDPIDYAPGEHSLTVAIYVDGEVFGGEVRVQVVRDDSPPPANVAETLAAMASLAAGHWLEIPNSHLEDVKPSPEPAGSGGTGAAIANWNGGAFDTKRERLIVWGGGHRGYAGNEIYVFDIPTLSWIRLTEPSPFPSGDPDNLNQLRVHPDGAPVARHTYNYLAYIPEPVDALFVGGGAALWTESFNDTTTHLYEFGKKAWSQKSQTPVDGIAAFCAVDADGTVWQHSTGSGSKLGSYDGVNDNWTVQSQPNTGLDYYLTAAVNTDLNWLVAVGKGQTRVWELGTSEKAGRVLSTSGDTEIESGHAPGVAYHPGTKTIVAWSGGRSVYQLNCTTGKWTEVTGQNNVSPGQANEQGTYGRFRYMPKRDRFVVVNEAHKNVFVYRLPAN